MDAGGTSILQYNKGSIQQLLVTVYPELEWLTWKFTNTPKYYWEDLGNQIEFMERAGKNLNIEKLEDWYRVTQKVTYNSKILTLLGIY